jgi:hypothetical protein
VLAVSTPMLREGLDRFVSQAAGGRQQAWRQIGKPQLHEVAA